MKFIMAILATFSISVVQAKDITIKVNGMVCSMCAQGITKNLKRNDSIKDVHVDLDKKIVKVTTEGDKDVLDQELTKHISEAGYNVAGIERK